MTTLLLEVTEYLDAAHWRWRLTEEDGAFIADHEVALDTGNVEYQGFVDLHGFLQHRADPGKRLASEAELVDRVGRTSLAASLQASILVPRPPDLTVLSTGQAIHVKDHGQDEMLAVIGLTARNRTHTIRLLSRLSSSPCAKRGVVSRG